MPGPQLPSGFIPLGDLLRRDIDERWLADKFTDIQGGIHRTQRGMWEANARIKEANGEVACERRLDEPEKK